MNRPTPEQIISSLISPYITEWHGPTADEVIEAVARHGYVIVHPDDFPLELVNGDVAQHIPDSELWRRIGWNQSHDAVFFGSP